VPAIASTPKKSIASFSTSWTDSERAFAGARCACHREAAIRNCHLLLGEVPIALLAENVQAAAGDPQSNIAPSDVILGSGSQHPDFRCKYAAITEAF